MQNKYSSEYNATEKAHIESSRATMRLIGICVFAQRRFISTFTDKLLIFFKLINVQAVSSAGRPALNVNPLLPLRRWWWATFLNCSTPMKVLQQCYIVSWFRPSEDGETATCIQIREGVRGGEAASGGVPHDWCPCPSECGVCRFGRCCQYLGE